MVVFHSHLSVLFCLQNFERSRAFTFLNEIKKRFQTTYGSRAQTALPYAMNSEFSSVLAAQLVRFCAVVLKILPFREAELHVPLLESNVDPSNDDYVELMKTGCSVSFKPQRVVF